MLKLTSKLILAFMLGGFMLAACNNGTDEKKSETPAADTAAPKMEAAPATTAPAAADTTPKMDTAATKPLKPGT